MTQDQAWPLQALIPHFGKDTTLVGIEIGVSGGTGSLSMLYYLPNLTLYSIDPWKHFPGEPFEASLSQECHDHGYQTTLSRLATFGDRSVIIRKTSDDALGDVPETVDFVYIDGHHTYEQCHRDIQNYKQKVKKGGLLGGHDYRQVPEVSRAVHELLTPGMVHFGDDFTWWVNI